MTESEYVTVANITKIKMTLEILGQIAPGPEYGITDEELGRLKCPLLNFSLKKNKEIRMLITEGGQTDDQRD